MRCLALIGAFWGSAYVASLDLIGKVFSYFSGLPSNGISRGVNNVAWLYEPRTRVCTLAGGGGGRKQMLRAYFMIQTLEP